MSAEGRRKMPRMVAAGEAAKGRMRKAGRGSMWEAEEARDG